AEAGRIHSPRQIVSPCRVRFNHLDFARNSFELCIIHTAFARRPRVAKALAVAQASYGGQSPLKVDREGEL
ncbi:MAG: hypothetical protein UX99_C0021G0001, partial [Candidatus Amesbacteria bacterium GW2011_GWB1_47_26]